jgi:hypothetical protein
LHIQGTDCHLDPSNGLTDVNDVTLPINHDIAWPKCCTHATACNTNLHNAGCSEKPQMWHAKHASMMQMSIAGDQHAIVDAKAHSNAHFDATKQDNTHETKASAVEHMCKQEATIHQEGCREVKRRMKTPN